MIWCLLVRVMPASPRVLRAQWRLFFGVTGLVLTLGPGFAQRPEAPALAIAHVSVVDPDLDRVSEDMTVIVQDGRILSISAAQAVAWSC